MPTPPAGRGVQVGLVVFALGVVALVADVVPFFLGHHDRPLWLNLACGLVPLGLLVATWSGIARGRAEQRRTALAVEALRADATPHPLAGADPAAGVDPPGSARRG